MVECNIPGYCVNAFNFLMKKVESFGGQEKEDNRNTN